MIAPSTVALKASKAAVSPIAVSEASKAAFKLLRTPATADVSVPGTSTRRSTTHLCDPPPGRTSRVISD
jgi:hypothetical protein